MGGSTETETEDATEWGEVIVTLVLEVFRAVELAEQSRTCNICFEDDIKRVDGYECNGDDRHFFCDECFCRHVQTKLSEDLAHLEQVVSCILPFTSRTWFNLRRDNAGG